MTNTLDSTPREVTLENFLEHLILTEDIKAQAIVAAIRAYYETLELELTVTLVTGKYLYEVLQSAEIEQFLILAVGSNPTLRDYIC